jgi:hypothetical protein
MGLVSLRAKGLVKVGETLWCADIGPLATVNQAAELLLLGRLEQQGCQRGTLASRCLGKERRMKQADAAVGVALEATGGFFDSCQSL